MLREVKDYFEELQEQEFDGRAYIGRRGRRHREKISDSYVGRMAILEMYNRVLS